MSGDDFRIIDAKLSEGAYRQLPSVQGWTRDDALSNQNRSVYTKDGKAKVVARGSDFSNPRSKVFWDDLGSDVLVGLGLSDVSSRNKNARRTADLAIQKYGKENVSATGHSLGGSQSLYLNRKTGIPATAFNAGVSPIETLFKRKYKGATNYITGTDPISFFSRGVKGLTTKTVKPKTKFSHSLFNFI
jgi:hypothetical protein